MTNYCDCSLVFGLKEGNFFKPKFCWILCGPKSFGFAILPATHHQAVRAAGWSPPRVFLVWENNDMAYSIQKTNNFMYKQLNFQHSLHQRHILILLSFIFDVHTPSPFSPTLENFLKNLLINDRGHAIMWSDIIRIYPMESTGQLVCIYVRKFLLLCGFWLAILHGFKQGSDVICTPSMKGHQISGLRATFTRIFQFITEVVSKIVSKFFLYRFWTPLFHHVPF